MCIGSLEQVKYFAGYMVFSMALTCFCFSGYIFTENALNGGASPEDKFKGKVAFGIGTYLAVGSILYL